MMLGDEHLKAGRLWTLGVPQVANWSCETSLFLTGFCDESEDMDEQEINFIDEVFDRALDDTGNVDDTGDEDDEEEDEESG